MDSTGLAGIDAYVKLRWQQGQWEREAIDKKQQAPRAVKYARGRGAPTIVSRSAEGGYDPAAGGAAREERVQLDSGAVDALVRAHGWQAWTPAEPPIPAEHPLGERCQPGMLRIRTLNRTTVEATGGAAGGALNTTRLRRVTLRQPMCLARHDHISERIRATGHWRDCGMCVLRSASWTHADGAPSIAC